ncbi:MAG: hypothetical protein GY710_25750, partial [Desulfobacteraceae bacterium]|nr:hypothetical protein [Desulfobacteraceae bacterium]
MNHKIFKKYLSPLLVLILIFFLISCNDKKDTTRTKSPAKAVQAVEKTTAVAVRKKDGNDTYISYVYENLKDNIKKENYEDPDSFDMPRVQFIGRFPKGADDPTIWSVKIDGTDLRQVMDEKEIFGNGYGTLNDTPVRSPNNRYIAFPLGSGDKVVFDLKTRKRFVVGKAPWFPNMAWRPNNKLVFDGNGLFEYDPVTRV